jgi:hypothetical protein
MFFTCSFVLNIFVCSLQLLTIFSQTNTFLRKDKKNLVYFSLTLVSTIIVQTGVHDKVHVHANRNKEKY